MTTITLPDDIPLGQALDLVLRHGLRYDHERRRLLPRIPNPGAGRLGASQSRDHQGPSRVGRPALDSQENEHD